MIWELVDYFVRMEGVCEICEAPACGGACLLSLEYFTGIFGVEIMGLDGANGASFGKRTHKILKCTV